MTRADLGWLDRSPRRPLGVSRGLRQPETGGDRRILAARPTRLPLPVLVLPLPAFPKVLVQIPLVLKRKAKRKKVAYNEK